ncbi:MAG: MATE family efflux transporter [Chitinophagales bacterium]|nr:MATE family efflux transporter [Chitinophagales bacterium]
MSLLSPAYQLKAKEAFKIALPIIAGQLGQILMGFFDTVQIGGLGHEYIAGLGFGNNLFWMVNLLGMGILFAISTLVSEAKGENKLWKAVSIYRSGMKAAIALSILFMLLTFLSMRYIHIFAQEEIVNEIALRYLRYIVPTVFFMFVFTACKQFLDGMGRTAIGMYITIGGLVLNVFLNWILIYGKFGMPRMEIEGAAIATMISRAVMTFVFLLIIRSDRSIRELRAQVNASGQRKKNYLPSILRIGIPAGLQFFFEVVAFQIAHFMSGWIGIKELSAHGIAIGLASITFMVITGISAAGNILTGFAYGAKDREGIRIAGNTIFAMTLGIEIIFAAVFLLFNNFLPTLYTDDAELITLASSMLVFAALFQISDGLQSAASGALRGIQDVRIPMVIALFSYWGVMMPFCYLLAFNTDLGLEGIWIGFIIGLTVASVLLLARFWWMVGRVKFEEI